MEITREDLRLVRRFASTGKRDAVFDEDDAFQEGCLGLLQAARRHDPAKGALGTIAVPRIKGQIADGRRRLDPVARSKRQEQRERRDMRERLRRDLGREPTTSEMIRALGQTHHHWAETSRQLSWAMSLDAPHETSTGDGDPVFLADVLTAAEPRELDERCDRLPAALARLTGREQIVLALYYHDDLALREIGEVLGVTESRVSQIRTRAEAKLRAALQVAR